MWGNFGGLNLKDLADKARAAAEKLDMQLNESVGIETPAKAEVKVDMEGLDDAWGDDDDDMGGDDLVVDPNDDAKEETTDQDEAKQDNNPHPPTTPMKELEVTTQEENVENGWEGEDDNLQLDEEEETESNLVAVEEDEAALSVSEIKFDLKPELPTPEPDLLHGPVTDTIFIDHDDGSRHELDTEDSTVTKELVEMKQDCNEIADEHEFQLSAASPEPSSPNHDHDGGSVHTDSPDSVNGDQALETVAPVSELELLDDKVDPERVSVEHDGERVNETSLPDFDTGEAIYYIDKPFAKTVDEFESVEASVPEMASSIHPSLEPPVVVEQPSQTNITVNEQTFMFQEQLEQLQAILHDTQKALQRREEQLMSKTEQLTEIEVMHEKEKDDLRNKIKDTKEEAKKRIQKAKERVEAAEAQLQSFKTVQNSSNDDAGKQAAIIAELRAEGESLARKQADMEKAVRSAKGEARELRESLENETSFKEEALNKIERLEKDLKESKDNLAAARRGESMADKFEEQLRKAKEEDERKGSLILSLEQQLKELRAEARELVVELEASQKGAAVESQQTVKRLRKEHSDAIADMEAKLHKTEKDAHAREDDLRHEVDEVRKRWQDAVRRADSLSMDIQSSTAPLLRQLESAERQSRARAAAAADIETKLRSELEDTILSKEKLAKERNEATSKLSLLERSSKENEDELQLAKLALGERTATVKQLEEKIEKLEAEMSKKQEQWKEVERLANEGVSRVRSEMTQTLVDSEERHRSQLASMQRELTQEREKRRQLEQQVSGLLENTSISGLNDVEPTLQMETKRKKLRPSEGQADILAGALGGLDRAPDDEDESDDDGDGILAHLGQQNSSVNSFAALAEMQSRMKATKQELEDLRRSLLESEKAKERLVIDLRDSHNAKERLPLFETRCQELTEENRRLEMEVNVLTEEMEEMRLMYRSQLEAYILSQSSNESRHAEQEEESMTVQSVDLDDEVSPES